MLAEEKDGKANRVLAIYEKLIKGEVIHKKHMATLFGVNEKTIQRDIEDIRAYLSNNTESKCNIDVEYRRDKKGYCINKREDSILNREDVLAVSKILLESKAFCKEEINRLITAVLGEIDVEQRKYVKELIGNEKYLRLKRSVKICILVVNKKLNAMQLFMQHLELQQRLLQD